jgi:hypothetical protein
MRTRRSGMSEQALSQFKLHVLAQVEACRPLTIVPALQRRPEIRLEASACDGSGQGMRDSQTQFVPSL